MKNPETPFFIGYVEQGIAGGQDPLSPPISISRNGSLAKWRGKLNFMDLRVNDPGLKNNGEEIRQILVKANTLDIETVITLPEYSPQISELPPENDLAEHSEYSGRRNNSRKLENYVFFKPALLALPSAVTDKDNYYQLTVEDCRPILEMAGEHGVSKVIVPVSEPGLFLDPIAEEEFINVFRELNKIAEFRGIKLHVRNGGLPLKTFAKLKKEFNCGLALNVGITHLEREDVLDFYNKMRNEISVVILQQLMPGMDKWSARKDAIELANKEYLDRMKAYQEAIEDKDDEYSEKCLRRWFGAKRAYFESLRNENLNLGLFQNGDLNLAPLLKAIRRDIDEGNDKYLLLETVPNIKNAEFIFRYLMPESFMGAF